MVGAYDEDGSMEESAEMSIYDLLLTGRTKESSESHQVGVYMGWVK